VSGEETLVVLAFLTPDLEGIRIPLPGLSPEDFAEARRLIRAGVTDAPAVRLLGEALRRGLGPLDEWGPGDDAMLAEARAQLGGEGPDA
jgi:hypothetical protein